MPRTAGPQVPMDPKQLQALDAPLIALTQQCGGDLRQLMFAFFSFLNRRTDFYLVSNAEDISEGVAKMGFKEGDAEKLLLASFRQFPLRRIPRQKGVSAGAAATTKSNTGAETKVKDDTKNNNKKDQSMSLPSKAAAKVSSKTTKEAPTTEPSAADKLDTTPKKEAEDGASNMAEVEYTEEGLQKPVGNGGSTPKYKWTQTLEECSVLVGVPKGFKGKDLEVTITPTLLDVRSKKPLPGDNSPYSFMGGTLVEKVRADESTWSLEGGVLIITLDKLKHTFWDTVLEGDEKIDTSLVDSRRHISSYDEVTQGQIRKILFDQNQQRKGLKTSDEILGQRTVPDLPPGVEYIDKKKLDDADKMTKS